MAYSDYGAFVYCNGKRRKDKEDVAAFASDEETFGESSENVPSGMRIWTFIFHQRELGHEYNNSNELDWINHIHHGIMGDGDIRVICHKQGLPDIYEATKEGFKKIKYTSEDTDWYEYDPIYFEYNGYTFLFVSNQLHEDNTTLEDLRNSSIISAPPADKPYYAKMITPEGDVWECTYDYEYGAGWTDVEDTEEDENDKEA